MVGALNFCSHHSALWWEQKLSAPPGAYILFGAGESGWQTVGTAILEAAGMDVSANEVRSTYFETLTQSVSAVAQSLSARFGSEVTSGAGTQLTIPPATTPGLLEFGVGRGGKSLGSIFVTFSDPLLTVYAERPKAEMQKVAKAAAGASGPSSSSSPAGAPAPQQTRTMELLLDVELPVSVSFGRAILPLKDVIKLTSGSIVELNRSITEPVEIIVNNCVIARGEVVVIEGNYGVRIDQIISRQERLRTLK
jgi:flagellar motor switch protein FliN/FliY